MAIAEVEVRPYQPADEAGWLRCRVLSFLTSAYFDDVVTSKPSYLGPSVEMVAVEGDSVAGILDVSIAGEDATIETVGVHPDHLRRGIGSSLLQAAVGQLPSAVRVLDAWTRDDEAANRWYQENGFAETFRYLHVYAKSDDELKAAVTSTGHDLVAARGFFHAAIEGEDELRQVFERVHVCRRYARER